MAGTLGLVGIATPDVVTNTAVHALQTYFTNVKNNPNDSNVYLIDHPGEYGTYAAVNTYWPCAVIEKAWEKGTGVTVPGDCEAGDHGPPWPG